jgi:hypothetical protein
MERIVSDKPEPPLPLRARDAQKIAREKRLAEALRANLKRRKALAKGGEPAPDAKQPPK